MLLGAGDCDATFSAFTAVADGDAGGACEFGSTLGICDDDLMAPFVADKGRDG